MDVTLDKKDHPGNCTLFNFTLKTFHNDIHPEWCMTEACKWHGHKSTWNILDFYLWGIIQSIVNANDVSKQMQMVEDSWWLIYSVPQIPRHVW